MCCFEFLFVRVVFGFVVLGWLNKSYGRKRIKGGLLVFCCFMIVLSNLNC